MAYTISARGTLFFDPPQRRRRQSIATVDPSDPRATPGSLYYTDEWQAYVSLRLRGDHVVIRKEKGRPMGRDHINGIEGFWSYAKNWLYPYRGVPRRFFHLYLGEVCWRFNNRGCDQFPLILALLKHIPFDVIRPILVQNR